MNETTLAAPQTQEKHPASHQVLSEIEDSAPIPGASLQAIEAVASTGPPDGQEAYEQGMVLKTVGLFRQAAEQFEKAAQDSAYALKALGPNVSLLQEMRTTGRGRDGLSPSPTSTLNIIERIRADPLPFRKNIRVTRTHSRIIRGLSMAPPCSAAVSRCRDANRVVELETNVPRESLTLGTTDVVDVAEFPAKRKVTVDRKRFLVVGYELIR